MAEGYILQSYAPTNEATEETKFHDQLQMVLEQVPCRDVKIVMGDMNAKVGMNNTGREEVMGKHGAGAEMNENDERWARNQKREASTRYSILGVTIDNKLTFCEHISNMLNMNIYPTCSRKSMPRLVF